MRALSFRSDGDGIKADPHQSSFWTKAVGADPRGVDFRPLALASPRKSSVPCPVQVQRLEALDEQRLLYRLLKPRPDGSTALTLTPLELIQRRYLNGSKPYSAGDQVLRVD